MRFLKNLVVPAALALAALGLSAGPAHAQQPPPAQSLLNVSYDPTRELYEALNRKFVRHHAANGGGAVQVEQSHGGSGKQARAVIDGLRADVVTLALGYDVTAVEQAGLIAPGWQQRLPNNSAPYTSTIVFLVRKGNPKGLKDWNDLVKPGVQVITPNPKTSGGARWNFLAAWAYAAGVKGRDLSTEAGIKESDAATAAAKASKAYPVEDDAKAKGYVTALFKNVPVLDTGARGSTITFAQKGVGDVLLAWENEGWLARDEFGADKFEIVYPSVTILAEPPVAVVDKVVDAKGTRATAEAYLKYLYTAEAQDVIGALHYRPRDLSALKKYQDELPPLKLFTIDEVYGGWDRAQKKFFATGGVFDEISR